MNAPIGYNPDDGIRHEAAASSIAPSSPFQPAEPYVQPYQAPYTWPLPEPAPPHKHREGSIVSIVVVSIVLAAIVIVGLAIVLAVKISGSAGDASPRGSGTVRTGPMGGEVMPTPGTTSGTATAGGVTVEGSKIAMGDVPNNVTVEPTWTLENTSDATVTLGRPTVEIREGCCPGVPSLDTTRLEPGESATLVFPLQMHDGMDGPHDFGVHVPVSGGDESSDLELQVTGDFHS